MANNELEISISLAFDCKRCPNRDKVESYEYPYSDLPFCPRDKLIAEIGHTPTSQQLSEGAEKHKLIFKGQMQHYDDFGTPAPVAIFQCPNAENSIPGIIMLERPFMS